MASIIGGQVGPEPIAWDAGLVTLPKNVWRDVSASATSNSGKTLRRLALMRCQNNTSVCGLVAVERVEAFPTPQLPCLRLDLCRHHASEWCSVLEKRDRDFDRIVLETGEILNHRETGFHRTSRVGRGVAKR